MVRGAVSAPRGLPLWLFASVFSLIFLRLSESVPLLGRLRPALLVTLFAWLYLFLRPPIVRWQNLLRSEVLRTFAIYLAIVVAVTPFSVYRGGSIALLRTFPFAILLSLVVALPLASASRDSLYRAIGWMAVAFALNTLRQNTSVLDVVGGARLSTGGSYDPNDLAAVASVLCAFFLMRLPLHSRMADRLMLLSGLALNAAVVVKTGSRGGVVALGVALVSAIIAMRGARRVWLTVALAIALPLVWQFGPEAFRVRTRSLFTIKEDYTFTSRAGRTEIWKRGVTYFLDNPLVGVGPNNFSEYEGRKNIELGIKGGWLTAHNSYLQAFVETGLFGGFFFCASLATAVRALLRRRGTVGERLSRRNPEALVMLASFATSAVFLSHAYAYLLFFVLGYVARLELRAASPLPTTSSQGPERGARTQRRIRPR
jgi:O-antigen ligase